jgi:hypothetical protein
MRTFVGPVLVNDADGNLGVAVGADGPFLTTPGGAVLANGMVLFGGLGVNRGPVRVTVLGEPAAASFWGDNNAKLDIGAGFINFEPGQNTDQNSFTLNGFQGLSLTQLGVTITDVQGKARVSADATGKLTASDASGAFSIVLDPQAGQISVLNTSAGFGSSVVIDFAGGVTINDAIGNSAVYKASGWSVNGDAGCAIGGGGSLNISGNLTVQGDVFLPGADCAEQFDVATTAALLPGSVVVFDELGALRECVTAYDKKVAGVVSGAGDYRPSIILDQDETKRERRAPVALIGKVFCNVDADIGGSIGVGDLLTTSETPGHAMRAVDPARAFGAVLGKALRPLKNGRGQIPILVALQ